VSWQQQQAAIMTDQLSGAVDITRATAQMLMSFAKEETTNSLTDMSARLRQIAREVLTAQSGMASPVSLFNRVFFAVGAEADVDAARLLLEDTAQRFLQEQTTARDSLCRKATALIPDRVSILTHSASSTVLQTLLHASEAGRHPTITCLEARPLYEGRQLAARLAENNIDATLIIDSAAYAILQNVEIVLLGADSLTKDGVISKVGSGGLAVCAQSLGIPCYFLADTSKVWPDALGSQPVHERAPASVWPDAPENVKVRNLFYDLTPWTAVSGIMTEQGLLTAGEIRAQCRDQPAHPWLQTIVAEVRSSVF